MRTTESNIFWVWGYCRCNVWPIAPGWPIQGCGRCKQVPYLMHEAIETRDEAVLVFFDNLGYYPYPFEKKE